MNDVLLMADFKSSNEACHKESYKKTVLETQSSKKSVISRIKILTGGLFVELSVPADMISQISSTEEVHDQVEVLSVLECVVHIDQERTVQKR